MQMFIHFSTKKCKDKYRIKDMMATSKERFLTYWHIDQGTLGKIYLLEGIIKPGSKGSDASLDM